MSGKEQKKKQKEIQKESRFLKREDNKIRRYLCMSMIGFFISAGTVFLLGFTGDENSAGELILMRVIGVLFWAGLIGGILAYVSLYRTLKENLGVQEDKKRLPSCLRFFGNNYAKAIDGIWLLTLGLTVLFSVTGIRIRFLETLSLFLLILTTYLHFIVTGRIFHYWNAGKQPAVLNHSDDKDRKRKSRAWMSTSQIKRRKR